MTPALEPWLEQADPADLLPQRRRDEARRIARPLSVVASTWFDATHGYCLVRDARGVSYGVPLVVDPDGTPRRAGAGDGTAHALLRSAPSPPDGLHAEVFVDASAVGPDERDFDVDQTNDLVVVGGQAVVKWDLMPGVGAQVGPERLRQLARAGFAGSPRTWALVGLETADGRAQVATVSEFVPAASDGWRWAVDAVRDVARGDAAAADADVQEAARLVAGLHVALAREGSARASDPDVERWVSAAEDLVSQAGLEPFVRERVLRAIAPIRGAVGTRVIPIHGDLHVGQILRSGTPARYLVTDFDGNPVDDVADRLAPQPAARDVAAMLASWDHVGRVVLRRTEDLSPDEQARVLAWIEHSQRSFLAEYARHVADDGPDLLDRRLVGPFQVLQECREYAYALRFLPQWRYVPDAALPAALDRLEGVTA